MLEIVVLQPTLARLVANRTVDRMPQEEILLDHRSSLPDFVAVGNKHRAVAGRRLAGGNELRQHLYLARLRIAPSRLHQTHAATRDDRQSGMPAVMGNVDPHARRQLDAVEPLVRRQLHFPSVDPNHRHVCVPQCVVQSSAGTGSLSSYPCGFVRRMYDSNSSRNLRMAFLIGQAAPSANPQIVVPGMMPIESPI